MPGRLLRCLVAGMAAWMVVLAPGYAFADTPEGVAHYLMGVFWEFRQQPDAALVEYRKAAAASPSVAAVHMRLGLASLQAGDVHLAIEAFQKAVALESGDVQARYMLALAQISARDFDAAARQYAFILQQSHTIGPQHFILYVYLGQFYAVKGEWAMASEHLEKALALQPKGTDFLVYADCLNALGYSYAQSGKNLDRAAQLLRRAIELVPDDAAYLDSLGWIYFRQGKLDDAMALLQQAIGKGRNPEVLDHIGDVYCKMGCADKALEAWREALTLDAGLSEVQAKIRNIDPLLIKGESP